MPGSTVTVGGTGLSAVTAVTLGGASATFTISSDTQLLFTVPNLSAGPATIAVDFLAVVVDPGAFAVTGGGSQPNPPTNLVPSNITETGFDLAWTASSGASAYTPQLNGVSTTPVTGTGASFSGLTPGTPYVVDVLASNSFGSSGPSKSITVTTLPVVGPPPPASNSELPLVLAGAGALALVLVVLMRRPQSARR